MPGPMMAPLPLLAGALADAAKLSDAGSWRFCSGLLDLCFSNIGLSNLFIYLGRIV
jgi:hypothetical protein